MKTNYYKADERGYANHGWLETYHSFSFAGYYNPKRLHFGMLRVLNDDRVAPGMGFGLHPHDNMEIITIPLSGVLAHKDSLGNEEFLKAGEVQVMSAGSGLQHSEYNGSNTEDVTLLQIWIFPDQRQLVPRYGQRAFEPLIGQWQELVHPQGYGDGLWIHQKAWISRCRLETGQNTSYVLHQKSNGVYFFNISGNVKVGADMLQPRDAMEVEGEEEIIIQAASRSDLLAIEVPMR